MPKLTITIEIQAETREDAERLSRKIFDSADEIYNSHVEELYDGAPRITLLAMHKITRISAFDILRDKIRRLFK